MPTHRIRPMRILVLSDLHLEHGGTFVVPDNIDFEVAVLAGDTRSPGRKAINWAKEPVTFGGRPAVVVPSNHEFYGGEMSAELSRMCDLAAGSNVHVSHQDSIVIDGVRFLVAILWTDFAQRVRTADGRMSLDLDKALDAASRFPNDYRTIQVADASTTGMPSRNSGARLLKPTDTLRMHRADRHWLQGELAMPFDDLTVVVTHHAPASGSVAKRYAADRATPAFVSHLSESFFIHADIWIHRHIHAAFDYREVPCRVVSNPHGYRQRDSSFENNSFSAGLVVEVG